VPKNLIGDDLAHLCGLLDRHGRLLASQCRLHDTFDPGPQFLWVDDRVVEDRPKLGYDPAVDPFTHSLKYLSPGIGYTNLVAQPSVQARAGGLSSRAGACDLRYGRWLWHPVRNDGAAIWHGRRNRVPRRLARL
jgi:hypothetical protein